MKPNLKEKIESQAKIIAGEIIAFTTILIESEKEETAKEIFEEIDIVWKRAKKDHIMTTDYNFDKELKELKRKFL